MGRHGILTTGLQGVADLATNLEKEINCRPLCQVGRKQLKVSGEVTLFEWRTRESIQPVGLISSVY